MMSGVEHTARKLSLGKKCVYALLLLLLAWTAAWGGMKTIGHALVQAAYEGRLDHWLQASFLEGRHVHELAYYQEYLDHLFWRATGLLVGWFVSLAVLAGLWRVSFQAIAKAPVWVAGLLYLLVGIAFCPPVFAGVFACGMVMTSVIKGLYWGVSLFFAVMACWWIWRGGGNSRAWRFLFNGLLLLVVWELSVRGSLRFLAPEMHQRLCFYAQRTYFSSSAFVGHPFLQFIGRTGSRLQADAVLAGVGPFNRLGFPGREIAGSKGPGVIRVVALGGSTTADGYPEVMETLLNETGAPHRFEVFNFGLGWHNSAHSVVCFMLNAVHLQPDYVVVLQGWNDASARNVPPELFRTDYGHAYTSFHAPFIWDKYAIRASVIYRWIREALVPRPSWWGLDKAIINSQIARTQPEWSNMDQLEPFESNMRAIIEVAHARHMKVILATSPRATNAVSQAHMATHMDQCNVVVRKLAEEEQTLLVDLDREMTGPMNEHFLDLGHVDRTGIEYKARCVGDAILRDRGLLRE